MSKLFLLENGITNHDLIDAMILHHCDDVHIGKMLDPIMHADNILIVHNKLIEDIIRTLGKSVYHDECIDIMYDAIVLYKTMSSYDTIYKDWYKLLKNNNGLLVCGLHLETGPYVILAKRLHENFSYRKLFFCNKIPGELFYKSVSVLDDDIHEENSPCYVRS